MSSASVSCQKSMAVAPARARAFDYLQLAKPRIAAMAMVAVAVGYLLGSQAEIVISDLLHACGAIFCVALSCSLLNQWYELDTDSRMTRTSDRPLVTGRIATSEALLGGLVLALIGVGWLWVMVNALTAVLAFATLVLYLVAYTPLKRVSSLCTTVGAIPGALPPVLGWTAASGQIGEGAVGLFLLLFTWQFPHFLAIATIHEKDYGQAGLKMLPTVNGRSVAPYVGLVYACVLLPVSLLFWEHGSVGIPYVIVAIVGGLAYLLTCFQFVRDQTIERARGVLVCSIVYLPAVLFTMTCDYFRLLS